MSEFLYSGLPNMYRSLVAQEKKSDAEKVPELLSSLLPGTKEDLSLYLSRCLKTDAEGRVSKQEFRQRWNTTVEILLADLGNPLLESQDALACCIC